MTQHDHEHHDHASHRHPPAQPDDTSPPGHYEVTILAIRDLLIENGVLTADQIRRGLETLDSWQPSRGAEIVVRAWTDPAFKRRLLENGNEAVAEYGVDMGGAKLTVLENTPRCKTWWSVPYAPVIRALCSVCLQTGTAARITGRA